MRTLTILSALFLAASAFGVSESAGTTGAQSLGIQTDPRGAAMGGAQIAAGEGAASVLWNPALLGKVKKNACKIISQCR